MSLFLLRIFLINFLENKSIDFRKKKLNELSLGTSYFSLLWEPERNFRSDVTNQKKLYGAVILKWYIQNSHYILRSAPI